jgi:CRISPR-associated protein Cas2
MANERLYVVAYDIANPKRWRRVFRLMNGYGRWLQLSVFQCRLTARRRAELAMRLEGLIAHDEDHVMILDLGPADAVSPRVESLGKRYAAPERRAIVI